MVLHAPISGVSSTKAAEAVTAGSGLLQNAEPAPSGADNSAPLIGLCTSALKSLSVAVSMCAQAY